MELNSLVPFDCEFVVMNWDCLLTNRGVQVIPRVLQQIPIQSTERVQKTEHTWVRFIGVTLPSSRSLAR